LNELNQIVIFTLDSSEEIGHHEITMPAAQAALSYHRHVPFIMFVTSVMGDFIGITSNRSTMAREM
jgi:hypothetical protein